MEASNEVSRDRPALFIDIEGFGHLYGAHLKGKDSLWGLGELMKALNLLGHQCDELGASRFFIHQFGDGFLVVDDDHVNGINRLVSVAVAVHRHVLCSVQHFCGSAISMGEISDVVGCYPRLKGHGSDGCYVMRNGGIMTINPVMGSALINTYGILKRARGAVIAIPSQHRESLDRGIKVSVSDVRKESGLLFIDWFNSSSEIITACENILLSEQPVRENWPDFFDKVAIKNGWGGPNIARTKRFLGT